MTIPHPVDRKVRYYATPLINGFAVQVGGAKGVLMIITAGPVAADWADIPEAIRHGWKIKGAQIDGSVVVYR